MNIPRDEISQGFKLISSVPKRVHFRDIHLEIDETNYQICTRVDFEPFEMSYSDIMETWGRLKHTFKNEITSEYESHAKSGSKYFTTKGGFVYRLSDHWGIVKTCIWTRAGEGNFVASEMISGATEIGRAHLSEFEIHRMKNHWKKDLILNPEWIGRMLTLVNLTNRLAVLKQDQKFNYLPEEDKRLIGSSCGMFTKHLFSIEDLEYSNEKHIFTL
jgi:hypothetical protein